VDVDALTPAMRRWLARRLHPKVLVATQSKVIEALVDEAGGLAPTTPVVSVYPREGTDLWHVAAVLLAPLVSAWAMERWGVTALSPGTLKLAARQVEELPLPADGDAWDEGARWVREVQLGSVTRAEGLDRLGAAMERAYGTLPEGAAVGWWRARVG
jgi:hypothetical protein